MALRTDRHLLRRRCIRRRPHRRPLPHGRPRLHANDPPLTAWRWDCCSPKPALLVRVVWRLGLALPASSVLPVLKELLKPAQQRRSAPALGQLLSDGLGLLVGEHGRAGSPSAWRRSSGARPPSVMHLALRRRPSLQPSGMAALPPTGGAGLAGTPGLRRPFPFPQHGSARDRDLHV
jgi:hypothetical protein